MNSKLKKTYKIIGLVLIIISGSFIIYKQVIKQLYIATDAIVVDIEEYDPFIDGNEEIPGFDDFQEIQGIDGEEISGYAPIVSYSINDVQYRLKSSAYETENGKSPYAIGDTIQIYVNPSDHEDFFISSIIWEILFPLIWFVIGVVFFLIGRMKKVRFDSTDTFETSKNAHWSIKYSLLILGLFLISTGIQAENFDLGFISLTGYEILDLVFKNVLIILGILVIVLFIIVRKRFFILKFTDDNIYIRKYKRPDVTITKSEVKVEWLIKKEKILTWDDIKSIKLFSYFHPPTYLLSLKDTRKKILFTTRVDDPSDEQRENPLENFINLKKVVDKSILGKYIADKKNELNL